MQRLLYIVLIICCSCERMTDWDIKPKQSVDICVDALITNEKKSHLIRICKPVYALNSSPTPVTGAEVFIFDGRMVYEFIENPRGSGMYYSDTNLVASMHVEYFLTVKYNKKNYSATASMRPATSFVMAGYESIGTSNLFSVKEDFSSPEPAMWHIYLDWSHVQPDSSWGMKNKALLVYYTLKTLDISQVFAPAKEKVFFPEGTKMHQKKFSLSDDYARFIRSMLSETEWRGGVFDVQPSNIITNFSEGAAGYFAVCTVISSDTITVKSSY